VDRHSGGNSGNCLFPCVLSQQENFVERSLSDFTQLDASIRAYSFDCNGFKICTGEFPVTLFKLKFLVLQKSASGVRKEVLLDIVSARGGALTDKRQMKDHLNRMHWP